MRKTNGIEANGAEGNGVETSEDFREEGHNESIGNAEVEKTFPKRKYLVLIGSTELVKRMTTEEAARLLEKSEGTSAFLEMDGRRFELSRDPFA